MQLYIEFTAQGCCLPLAYRHHLQGLIYDCLRSDPLFSTALHDGGAGAAERRFKLFTFGQLEGNYTVREKQIYFHDNVSLEIRSVNTQLMLLLLNAFSTGKELRLGMNRLYVQGSTLENRRISASRITVRTRSPIVAFLTLPDGKTRFFSPEEELFYSLLRSNAARKWKSLYKTELPSQLLIGPASASFKKQVTLFKGTRITAWDGQFTLEGDLALLNLLYNAGLGAKSSQGFGMFEPILWSK